MSEKSLADEIIEALKGKKTPQETNQLIDQIQKEGAFYNALKEAGLSPSIDDLTERGRLQPYGILSLVQKIKQIDEIELIKLIETIQTIQSITNIENITKIKHGFFYPTEIQNPSFQTADFTGWKQTNCVIADGGETGDYCAKLTAMTGSLKQYVKPFYGDDMVLSFLAKSTKAASDTIHLQIRYYDGYIENFYANSLELWFEHVFESITHKPVWYFTLSYDEATAGNYLSVTDFNLQPIRPQPVSLGGTVDLTAGVGSKLVDVSAVDPYERAMVYDAGFHGAVDGLHYFYFGTTTTPTTRRFCTMNTKGLIHKSFPKPRFGDAADSIYLFSSVAETGMPYDLGYKVRGKIAYP